MKSKDNNNEVFVFGVFWTEMNQQPFGWTFLIRDGGFPVVMWLYDAIMREMF